ncbi:MAG: phospholipase B family protein [Candidatus Thermoplasmatota archaeon]|nr:phospholipase B family protein [Candidatus Thermoplasmatota archaeon]
MQGNSFVFKEVKGSPVEIGRAIGKNFSREIRRTIDSFNFIFNHDFSKSWQWLIEFSRENFRLSLDEDIREEIEGIVSGYNSTQEVGIGFDDILALNATFDAESFLSQGTARNSGSCTSFIATGDYTTDGDVILAHSTWWRYFTAVNFNLILKVVPDGGLQFVMQTAPGLLFSGTDFYYNERGIMASETTLDGIKTYNPKGTPIFQRLRLAIQHSSSIDAFATRIIEGNTGGYANDYLIGDGKNREIGLLEIATYNHVLVKKNNGYFPSSNIVQFDEVRSESNIKYDGTINSDNSRLSRLNDLLSKKGMNVDTYKDILADHFDYSIRRDNPGKNSICGHREIEPNLDSFDKKKPYYPVGAIDGKIVTGDGALRGEAYLKWGKPCSATFDSARFLSLHPEYVWTKEFLEDIGSSDWEKVDHRWAKRR